MEKNNNNLSNHDEIVKAAQEEALKAVYEQAQSLFGDVPGLNIPSMEDVQAQIQTQLKSAVPNLEEIQAQQAAMGTLGNITPEEISQAARANMVAANRMMDFIQDENSYTGMASDEEDFDSLWDIERAEGGKLDAAQCRLLAFGAPLFVYNSEQVDSYESIYDTDTIKEQMESWWDITDHDTALEIVEWLLNEEGKDEKTDDVCRIEEIMLQEKYCVASEIPQTTIAWDLVRVVNVGRWTYQCGYITLDEMWQIMQLAEESAHRHFSSWEEYGRSFVLGRGAWHGDPDDCETAYEIISTLLESAASPWKEFAW